MGAWRPGHGGHGGPGGQGTAAGPGRRETPGSGSRQLWPSVGLSVGQEGAKSCEQLQRERLRACGPRRGEGRTWLCSRLRPQSLEHSRCSRSVPLEPRHRTPPRPTPAPSQRPGQGGWVSSQAEANLLKGTLFTPPRQSARAGGPGARGPPPAPARHRNTGPCDALPFFSFFFFFLVQNDTNNNTK